MAEHAKRTTVKRVAPGVWLVTYATFDQPASAYKSSRIAAMNEAVRFERFKARSRFIEARRAEKAAAFERDNAELAARIDLERHGPPRNPGRRALIGVG